ncbi:hypothetical protein OPV22_012892 [Ensete ventricosum]|uniref:Uncharacterized protein n=1 Tax=Ensete ventricosum TaxID=4639 RepID=A0AAV8R3P2_ENSVE|nr:hypothetical protein OPV22_012892 [Ensete ventricosum]
MTRWLREEEGAVIYGPCLGKRCRQAFFFLQLLNRNGHSMMKSICGCRSVKRADESFEEMADRRNMPSAVLGSPAAHQKSQQRSCRRIEELYNLRGVHQITCPFTDSCRRALTGESPPRRASSITSTPTLHKHEIKHNTLEMWAAAFNSQHIAAMDAQQEASNMEVAHPDMKASRRPQVRWNLSNPYELREKCDRINYWLDKSHGNKSIKQIQLVHYVENE